MGEKIKELRKYSDKIQVYCEIMEYLEQRLLYYTTFDEKGNIIPNYNEYDTNHYEATIECIEAIGKLIKR